MSDSDPTIRKALAVLRSEEDPDAAQDAEAALEWLIGDAGPEALSQERLQAFLWYSLPMKWLTDGEHHRRVTQALARALDLLGLPRYAAICRSDTTSEVLAEYARSDAAGKRACRKAMDASGVEPPDLPELQWGPVMGMEESRARSSVAEALELAIAGGELAPGARGWKARQQELTGASLQLPRVEHGDRSLGDLIRQERVDAWLDRRRSPTRMELFTALADRIRVPAQLPPGAHDPLPPVRWLLERLADGQALTKTGNLNRALVQDAAPRFGWWKIRVHGLPNNENELYGLAQTDDLVRGLGLTRRAREVLKLSKKGRELLADPESLWRAVAHAILPDDAFGRAAGELALAVLARQSELDYRELDAIVRRAIEEEDWRESRSGDRPNEDELSVAWHRTTNLLRALNLLEDLGDWPSWRYRLTEVGRATALEALHQSAAGPRSYPLG